MTLNLWSMIHGRSAVLAVAITIAATMARPVSANEPQPPASPSCAGKMTIIYDTNPVCNCTDAPATIEVCHSASVELGIDVPPVTASTGYSSSTCGSQEKAPGECLFWRYTFTCCYQGWFSGWKCTSGPAKLMSSTTTC